METRTYGIYFVKDSFSNGRVSGFMPYPNDLAAMYGFKQFCETEDFKKFPIPRKIELIKLCEVDQITDMALMGKQNVTVCNGVNFDELIKINLKRVDEV